jgi:hypothetical protein
MHESERIYSPDINTVIQPGDLVWGGWFRKNETFQRFLHQGILPHNRQDDNLRGCRPNAVCLGLMSNTYRNPWDNYELTAHHGPKSFKLIPDAEIHIGILISRQKLINNFSGYIQAVGENFRHPLTRLKYGFNLISNCVMGIPISKIETAIKPYKDEIIINYSDNREIQAITKELWTGIIVYPFQKTQIIHELQTANIQLPVISIPM